MKKNKTCGFRKGSQSRSRVPLSQVQSPDTSLALAPSQTCAPETEKRKCTLTKKAPCERGKCSVQTQETGNTENYIQLDHLNERNIRKNSYISMKVFRLQKNSKEHVVCELSPTVDVMTDGAIIQHPEMLCFCQCVSVTHTVC